jgi:hypothetical protein
MVKGFPLESRNVETSVTIVELDLAVVGKVRMKIAPKGG